MHRLCKHTIRRASTRTNSRRGDKACNSRGLLRSLSKHSARFEGGQPISDRCVGSLNVTSSNAATTALEIKSRHACGIISRTILAMDATRS